MKNKMMAMRKALRDITSVAEEMTRGTMSGEPVDRLTVDGWALRLCDIYESSCAVPLRNCDVGSAEEQTRRMEAEYCYVQKSCYESPSGRECPLHKAGVDCRLIWAQMPYKEGEIR